MRFNQTHSSSDSYLQSKVRLLQRQEHRSLAAKAVTKLQSSSMSDIIKKIHISMHMKCFFLLISQIYIEISMLCR